MIQSTRARLGVALSLLAFTPLAAQSVSVSGPEGLRRWHRIDLELTGPTSSETATPNPFLDLRMQVRFRHVRSGLEREVSGHFAADGNAAETGATSGNVWRAHFAPELAGAWSWEISFRTGTQVAIDLDPAAGTPLAPFDGLTGSFYVNESDKTGRDMRARGFLRYVGEHHLRFEDGTYFLKVGADSPENLLAYDDIDNTTNINGRRKSWSPHVGDWRPGDPEWRNGLGHGLIGALNYLASEGMNVISFLTLSYAGDDRNVFPWVDPTDPLRFDVSKLDQWEVVFTHGDRMGLYLHFKMQETENDQLLDGGSLGVERRVYYRELISRYAHHLALNWNLGEENTNTPTQRNQFSSYIRSLDPYGHPVVVHSYPFQQNIVFSPHLGADTIDGPSLQTNLTDVHDDTLNWVTQSAAAGYAWVVANDEQGDAQNGIVPDAVNPGHDQARREVLWGNILAGGAGVEAYFGYAHAHSDLTCEDFRSRDEWWDQCRYAAEFFVDGGIPFWRMWPTPALAGGARCLSGDGWYVLETGGAATTQPTLDLRGEPVGSVFDVRWFDPKTGGALVTGSRTTVIGGQIASLGQPPAAASGSYWIVRVSPTGMPLARAEEFGVGCAGSSGLPPRLVAEGAPRLGNDAFAVRLIQARPIAFAFLVVGPESGSVPLGPCTQFVTDPAGAGILPLQTATDLGGVARLPLPIPVDPVFAGARLVWTGIVADPGAAYAGQVAVANGLDVTIGF
jgi:hypothetical protein